MDILTFLFITMGGMQGAAPPPKSESPMMSIRPKPRPEGLVVKQGGLEK